MSENIKKLLEATVVMTERVKDSLVTDLKEVRDDLIAKDEELETNLNNLVTSIDSLDAKKANKEELEEKLRAVELIPGPPGQDYVLTGEDKEEIAGKVASKIKVPVVEKVIEKTEVIVKEQPIVTNEIKEVAIPETPIEIRDKLIGLEDDEKLPMSAIKLLDDTIATLQNRTQLLVQIASQRTNSGNTTPTITGLDTQVLFFDGDDTPAGHAGLTYDKTTGIATLTGGLNAGTLALSSGNISDVGDIVITTPGSLYEFIGGGDYLITSYNLLGLSELSLSTLSTNPIYINPGLVLSPDGSNTLSLIAAANSTISASGDLILASDSDLTDTIVFDSTGGTLTVPGSTTILSRNGLITFGGVGGTYNESLTFNFEQDNQVAITSATGVTSVTMFGIGLSNVGGGSFADIDTRYLYLNGTTTGKIGLQPPSSVTSYNVTFPSAQGAANSTLYNNGSGTLSWKVLVSDDAYGSGWNGVTDVAPSQNAVYDQFVTTLGQFVKIDGTTSMTGDLTISKATPGLVLTDSGGDDYKIVVTAGVMTIQDTTLGTTLWSFNPTTKEILTGNNASGTSVAYNVAAGQTHDFRVNNINEFTVSANNFDFNNGSVDTGFNFATNGVLAFKVGGVQEVKLTTDGWTFEHGTTDTGMDWSTDGKMIFLVGAVNYFSYSATEIVANETGTDTDFRIESDGDANNFFSDGGTNRIGIGMNNPGYKLDVTGDINASGVYRVGGTAGVSGTFTTADAKTVTVTSGIITSIV